MDRTIQSENTLDKIFQEAHKTQVDLFNVYIRVREDSEDFHKRNDRAWKRYWAAWEYRNALVDVITCQPKDTGTKLWIAKREGEYLAHAFEGESEEAINAIREGIKAHTKELYEYEGCFR